MNRRNFLQTVGTAVPAAAATAWMTRTNSEVQVRKDKDVVERILDTRKIRYNYIANGPLLEIEPNTRKLSGVFYDLTQRLGEMANLEIQWNSETTFANYTEDLHLGKCDVIACGIWPSANRAKAANFSMPAFYSGVGIYVRRNDHRFDDDVQKLNDSQFRITTLDGEMSQSIQESDFPKASVVGLPNNSDISMLAENVATGKADATFMEKALAFHYMKKNPGSLRNLVEAKPIRVFENTWAFNYGSERLKTILDSALKEMIYSGYVDHTLVKYNQQDGFYRVHAPIG